MLTPSTRKAVLPHATTEEEIIGGQRVNDDTAPAKRNKPSTTFLTFEISSDDGFKARADNWNGRCMTSLIGSLFVKGSSFVHKDNFHRSLSG